MAILFHDKAPIDGEGRGGRRVRSTPRTGPDLVGQPGGVGLFESGSIRGRFIGGDITEGDMDIARVLSWANKMVQLSLPAGHLLVDILRDSNASKETGAYLQVLGWGDGMGGYSFSSSGLTSNLLLRNYSYYSIVVTDWLAAVAMTSFALSSSLAHLSVAPTEMLTDDLSVVGARCSAEEE
eukprot:gene31322-40697_t